MISIVIPTYNDSCVALVKQLVHQAVAIKGLNWEIIVADDASTDEDAVKENSAINDIPHCQYMRRNENAGRAQIRNFLAKQAQGEWLLYIDGDAKLITDSYLELFFQATQVSQVCYGGYRMMPGPSDNLRWLYEQAAANNQSIERRRKHPYKSFNISNLLIRRDLMLANPLDRRFVKYGYEDVLLGKQLQEKNITVHHINAPVGYFEYEDNTHFVNKTEEGLQTLYQFQDELQGYSTLLKAATNCNPGIKAIFMLIYRLSKNKWRRNLCGASPSLIIFKLYKLGYFMSLSQHAECP